MAARDKRAPSLDTITSPLRPLVHHFLSPHPLPRGMCVCVSCYKKPKSIVPSPGTAWHPPTQHGQAVAISHPEMAVEAALDPRSLPAIGTAHRGVSVCPLGHTQARAFLTTWTGKSEVLIPGLPG